MQLKKKGASGTLLSFFLKIKIEYTIIPLGDILKEMVQVWWILFTVGGLLHAEGSLEWASQVRYPVTLGNLSQSFLNMTVYEEVCSYSGIRRCIARYVHLVTNGQCFFQQEADLLSVSHFNKQCDYGGLLFNDVTLHCALYRTPEEEADYNWIIQYCSPPRHIKQSNGILPELETWSGLFLSTLCFPRSSSNSHYMDLCIIGYCESKQASMFSLETCTSYCSEFAGSYSGTYGEAEEALCTASSPLCGLARNLTTLCAREGVIERSRVPAIWNQYLSLPLDSTEATPVSTVCSPGYPYTPPCDSYRGCRNNTLTDCPVANMTCKTSPLALPLQRTCTCPEDYTGQACEVKVDDCISHACVHGTCVDGIETYTCTCDSGWTGVWCDINVDECHTEGADYLCGEFGVCADTPGGFECACLSGWETSAAGGGTPCSIQVPCARLNEYLDLDTQYCHPCAPTCTECRGPGEGDCTACLPGMVLEGMVSGRCIQQSDRFQLTTDIRDAMIGLACAYLVIFVVFGILRWKHSAADNMAVVTYSVAVVNIVTDIMFTSSISDLPRLFWTCILFIAVTCAFNVLGTGYFIVRYMRDSRVGAWVEHNHTLVTLTIFFGAATVQVLRILSSHILDSDKLKVVFPEYAMTRVKILSVFTLFLQDLPQLCVQIYYGATYTVFNPYMIISICASMISVVFGVASRLFLCMAIYRKSERVDMNTQTPVSQPTGVKRAAEPTGLETLELTTMQAVSQRRSTRSAIIDSMRKPDPSPNRERLLPIENSTVEVVV